MKAMIEIPGVSEALELEVASREEAVEKASRMGKPTGGPRRVSVEGGKVEEVAFKASSKKKGGKQ